MYRYVIRRVLLMIPVIIGVSFLVFVILDLAPGSVVDIILPTDATDELRAQVTHELGLDQPVLTRYVQFFWGMLHGDFGYSYVLNQNVLDIYLSRLPATAYLAIVAVAVAILLSIPLGIFAATHHGTIIDSLSVVLSLIGMSMPGFWLGIMLMLVFSLWLGWLPSGGNETAVSVILPAITLGLHMMASLTRTTRSSMLDVLGQEYLRFARAKGTPERRVIRKHALKNALIPIITVMGTMLATALGGSVITETVFSWNGVGRLVIDAINSRDTNLATGSIIMTTIMLSVVLLLVDLLYAAVDPRIKAQYSTKGGKKKHA